MAALQNLIQGFAFSFDLNCYLMAALGTLLGIVIGALPGLTATTGVTIFLPMTFYMEPVPPLVSCWVSTAAELTAAPSPPS